MMDNADFVIGRLLNFDELQDFYCGEGQMDEFIHGNLKECSINHYCTTYYGFFSGEIRGEIYIPSFGNYISCCSKEIPR